MSDILMESPVFIVGASRSGTTLLRLMLNAHSHLALPQELKYFNSFPHLDWPNWRRPQLREEQYRRFVRHFLERRQHIFDSVGIRDLDRQILDSHSRDLREPYRVAVEAWASHFGKQRWGEKTPHNLYYVDILHDMFPNARFIQIVRDPRAVVASMNNSVYFPGDTAFNALNWLQAVTVGYELVRNTVPESQLLTLRYEDIVADPAGCLQATCGFIGERFEPAMLDFHRDSSRYMGTVIRTETVTQPVSSVHADKWKETLSRPDIVLVESICRSEMTRFNYEPTGASLPASAMMNKAIKSAYWKWKTRGRRAQRGQTVQYPMFARMQRWLAQT
ncbi:MAG TPA: sulfotransferase [Rhodothermales bacterium]|nr:sulfotransferase [Rhodothermales bacterium]